MATNTPYGSVTLFEDFVRDNVTNLNETNAGGASQDIVNRHGGWWRQTLAGDDGDACLIAGERAFEVDEGNPVILEARVQSSDVSVTSAFIGLTDDPNETGAVIIEDEDGTLNTVATDAVGFLLEGEQDLTWQRVGVQNDVDNTQAAFTGTTDAADAITQTLRLELWAHTSGTAEYYIDGKLAGNGEVSSWFRSSILYAPAVSSDDRNTAFTFDIDYIFCEAPRGSATSV